MTSLLLGLPEPLPCASIFITTSMPSITAVGQEVRAQVCYVSVACVRLEQGEGKGRKG